MKLNKKILIISIILTASFLGGIYVPELEKANLYEKRFSTPSEP